MLAGIKIIRFIFAQISQGGGGRKYINYSYFYGNASKLAICIVNSKTEVGGIEITILLSH